MTRGKIIILIAAVMLIGAGVAAVLLRDGNFVSQQPGHGYEMMENKEIKELPDETKSDPEPPVNVTHEQPKGIIAQGIGQLCMVIHATNRRGITTRRIDQKGIKTLKTGMRRMMRQKTQGINQQWIKTQKTNRQKMMR